MPRPRGLAGLALTSLAAVLGFSAPAGAVPVSVTPTTVTLAPGHATALITLTNESDDPTRFETALTAWTESRDGQTALQASQDVVVFPQLIALQPHETKKVRIGTELAPGAAERSYRLILQELPQFSQDSSQVKIQVLSKISLPVFFAPRGAAAKPAIQVEGLQGGVLAFDVANNGSAHFMLRRISISGHSTTGGIFTINSNGWYVLADGQRSYRLALAAADCKRSTEIVIRAESDSTPVEARVTVNMDACGDGRESHFVKIDSTSAPF